MSESTSTDAESVGRTTHWAGFPFGSAINDARMPAEDDCVTTHEITGGAQLRLRRIMRGISAIGFGERLNATRDAVSDDSASNGTPVVQKFDKGTFARNAPAESSDTLRP